MPSFIFLPPTPLPKTQLPPPLPQSIFRQHHPIIPLHITQFIHKHPLTPLLPPPPPYLPHHHPPQFTQKLTPKPYSLILFHQIHKPHPHLFNILLQ
ncbi:AAA family ATPase, partial [Staphylococcus epidermidis]|uniref:AAA family ATPase n=1 Tax=Staphylococcus epidermidis TaxID=1282 RepID=UPI0037DA7316